jgi:hypothetical protein
MELNGWSSLQMLRRYGVSARARRSYDRIMGTSPWRQAAPRSDMAARVQVKRDARTVASRGTDRRK